MIIVAFNRSCLVEVVWCTHVDKCLEDVVWCTHVDKRLGGGVDHPCRHGGMVHP